MSSKPSEVPVKVTPAAGESAPNPMRSLREQIDRVFDEFPAWFPWRHGERSLGRRPSLMATSTFSFATPAVDVTEREDAFELTAEVPGAEQKDIEVVVEDDMLILRGEKKAEREEGKEDYHLSERSYGAFQRAFQIPPQVQADKISADFKNGVLKITLPKNAEAKSRQRQVEIRS